MEAPITHSPSLRGYQVGTRQCGFCFALSCHLAASWETDEGCRGVGGKLSWVLLYRQEAGVSARPAARTWAWTCAQWAQGPWLAE